MVVETKGLREEGERLFLPHNGGELELLHRVYGPGTYTDVGEKIEQDGLKRPTMVETASFVHFAFISDNKSSREIRDIIKVQPINQNKLITKFCHDEFLGQKTDVCCANVAGQRDGIFVFAILFRR